jgi:TolB-like protein/Tfp pilus assembly protein PilF/class 3 adenylate cyclase
MPTEQSSDVKFEIGHVLFIDIVGYSKLLINEQSEQIQTLREIVRGTEQFRLAEAEGKLLRLPTGDGGALVFRNSPEAPVLCAMEINKALKSHPELQVRMGIHSGPVNAVVDLNEQANIAGAGINIAQRVMDCGDAGHILLSKRVADDLEQYPRWRPHLYHLGECEVKHGHKVDIVNLFTAELGNSERPKRLATTGSATALAPVQTKPASSHKLALIIATCVAIGALAIGCLFFWQRREAKHSSPAPTIPEKSIAVLPFENLSDDKANAYFADGIQDDILTKLASIADLKVISRTSTSKYKSRPEDLKTVAQQLGVATVMEGTVQRAGEKVRINVQLIDARADAHLWAKSYDRDLKDVFAVESEVSQEVADALRAKLSLSEAKALATAPTRDPAAYDFFLKGEYELREGESVLTSEPFDRADAYYRQALSRDPNFALAAARLAHTRLARHWYLRSTTPAELDEIKTIVDRALALAPDLAESHVALGVFYYRGHRQYEPALKEFRRALELQPNNVNARKYCGYVYRRQGQWERCLAELTKAEELDPRAAETPGNIGETYVNLRQWNEAKRAGSRSLALDPHHIIGMRVLVGTCVNGEGDIEGAKRALATLPASTRLTVKAIRGNVANLIDEGIYLHVLERDFPAALKEWETESAEPTERARRLSARVALRVLAGAAASATGETEEARALLEETLRERPDDAFAMTQLSWVYVALGRNADALRVAHQAADSLPIERDALNGTLFALGLAQIQARTGEAREAVKALRQLLSIPAGWAVSLKRLKIDPVWDPIRNDPEFQQLLAAGNEQIGPNK